MQYFIENNRLRAMIHTYGAELCSLYDKQLGREIIWQGDPSIWAGHSPLLFPIVGKLKDDQYSLEHSIYPMPKHGFAKSSEFSAVSQSASSITLSLTDSPESRACYPYAFALDICFMIEGNCLEMTHTVRNPSASDTLPFSIGAHPAFNCELGDRLLFEHPEVPLAYGLGPDLLLGSVPHPVPFADSSLSITRDLFDHDALILQDPRSRFAVLQNAKHGGLVRIDWFDAPVLGLWAKPGAPYVCVEPWYGIDDHASVTGQLMEKPRIVLLPPGESFRFPVRITALREGCV